MAEPLQVLVPRLHPGQRRVLAEARTVNVAVCGRRWRKTTMCMRIVLTAALRGKQCLWFSPTYMQSRIGWEELRRASNGVLRMQVTQLTAIAPGCGRILFRSLDAPERARGLTGDVVVLDEAGDIRAEAYHEVVRPTMLGRDGVIWLIGTPRGLNWFWEEYRAAEVAEDGAAWQIPTVGARIVDGELVRVPHPLENPDIPFREIERYWQSMPERMFRAELLAEWTSAAGSVFSRLQDAVWRVGDDGALVPWCTPAAPVPGRVYVAGVDLARVRDLSVVTVLDVTERPYRQAHLAYWRNVPWEVQVERVAAAVAPYGCRMVLVDRTGIGDMPFWTLVQRYPDINWQGVTLSVANKAAMVQQLALMFQKAEVKLLADRDQSAQLEIFEARERDSGVVTYAAPAGRNDDMVMALVLAAEGGARPEFGIV